MDQQSERQVTESVRSSHAGTLVERMGIEFVEASPRRVVGTMPVAGNIQPYGLLHGGASCVLAESLGSVGAALHAGPGRAAVGIEISATHHSAVRDGVVTGVATMLHGGRTLVTYEVVVSREDGRRVCTARLTCLLRDRVPGAAGSPPAGQGRSRDLLSHSTPRLPSLCAGSQPIATVYPREPGATE